VVAHLDVEIRETRPVFLDQRVDESVNAASGCAEGELYDSTHGHGPPGAQAIATTQAMTAPPTLLHMAELIVAKRYGAPIVVALLHIATFTFRNLG